MTQPMAISSRRQLSGDDQPGAQTEPLEEGGGEHQPRAARLRNVRTQIAKFAAA